MKYLLASLLLVASQAHSAELALKPGMWETTTTTGSGVFGIKKGPSTQRQCIKDKTYNPEKMVKDVKDCKILNDNLLNKNTLAFDMECTMHGTKTLVKGKYFTQGDVGNGDMKMQVEVGGMSININMAWDAKRVGDC